MFCIRSARDGVGTKCRKPELMHFTNGFGYSAEMGKNTGEFSAGLGWGAGVGAQLAILCTINLHQESASVKPLLFVN